MSRKLCVDGFATLLAMLALLGHAARSSADEPVVTVIADFDDESVAAGVIAANGAPLADCRVSSTNIPARGQRSLAVEVPSSGQAAATVGFRYRLPTRFEHATRVAAQVWVNEGDASLAFRLRDSADHVFESTPLRISHRRKWGRVSTELDSSKLREAGAAPGAKPTLAWPIEVIGLVVQTRERGRQVVFIDDLEVEHDAPREGMVGASWKFDRATRLYEPGSTVQAALTLENLSRTTDLRLSIKFDWNDSLGRVVDSTQASISLPKSGADFRSRQDVPATRRFDEPGLHRLSAQVLGVAPQPVTFESSIAVTPSNRARPRGRATFFGVHSNLLREPAVDRALEIELADELGVHLLVIDLPWSELEPQAGRFDFGALDGVIESLNRRDIACQLIVCDPPADVTDGEFAARQERLLTEVARRFGRRVRFLTPMSSPRAGQPPEWLEACAALQERLRKLVPDAEVLPPAVVLGGDGAAAGLLEPSTGGMASALRSEGDAAAALELLQSDAFARVAWTAAHRWLHRPDPISGVGSIADAVGVLRYFVEAARRGVGGVVWLDLRDPSDDPRDPMRRRGLVSRDFNPRASLIGFATAVHLLNGMQYGGALSGTPDAYDGHVFLAGEHQLALLFPKANHTLPVALAPVQLAAGALQAMDFEQRSLALYDLPGNAILVASIARPMFFSLDLQRAESDAQLTLASPWISAPRSIDIEQEGDATLELILPAAVAQGFAQLVLERDSPIRCDFSAQAVRGAAGDRVSVKAALRADQATPFDQCVIHWLISYDGARVDLAQVVRKVLPIRPGAAADVSQPAFRVAELQPSDPLRPGSRGADSLPAMHAAYTPGELRLAWAIPNALSENAELRVGLARSDSPRPTELVVRNLNTQPTVAPADGFGAADAEGCTVEPRKTASGATMLVLTIPWDRAGRSAIAAGMRVRLSTQLTQTNSFTGSKRIFRWGRGLDGSRSADDFGVFVLSP